MKEGVIMKFKIGSKFRIKTERLPVESIFNVNRLHHVLAVVDGNNIVTKHWSYRKQQWTYNVNKDWCLIMFYVFAKYGKYQLNAERLKKEFFIN